MTCMSYLTVQCLQKLSATQTEENNSNCALSHAPRCGSWYLNYLSFSWWIPVWPMDKGPILQKASHYPFPKFSIHFTNKAFHKFHIRTWCT